MAKHAVKQAEAAKEPEIEIVKPGTMASILSTQVEWQKQIDDLRKEVEALKARIASQFGIK